MSTVFSDIWPMAMYIVHCTESPLKINVDYELLFFSFYQSGQNRKFYVTMSTVNIIFQNKK